MTEVVQLYRPTQIHIGSAFFAVFPALFRQAGACSYRREKLWKLLHSTTYYTNILIYNYYAAMLIN